MCGKDFFPMDTVGTNKVSFKSTNRGWWEESRGSADFSFKWISTPSFLYLFDLQRRSPFCLWRLPRPWMNCSLAAKSHCQSPQFGTSLDVWHQGREGFRHCQDWRDKCATSLSDLQWWSTNGSRGGLLSAIDHWMTGISNGFFKKDPCSATFFFFLQADADRHDSTHSLTQPFSDLLGFLIRFGCISGKDLKMLKVYVC